MPSLTYEKAEPAQPCYQLDWMPRFFFHVEDGDARRDGEGTELADLDAARIEAATLAGELLRDRPQRLWDAQRWRMTVADETDRPLFVIEVAAAPASATIHQLHQRDG